MSRKTKIGRKDDILLYGAKESVSASKSREASAAVTRVNSTINENEECNELVVRSGPSGSRPGTADADTLVDEKANLEIDLSVHTAFFKVNYLEVPREVAKKYLNRHAEKIYEECCGQTFELHLFPPVLKQQQLDVDGNPIGPSYRYSNYYQQLSRIVTGVRVRKVMLQEESSNLMNRVNQLRELEKLCNSKLEKQNQRVIMLESEMDNILDRQAAIEDSRNGVSGENVTANIQTMASSFEHVASSAASTKGGMSSKLSKSTSKKVKDKKKTGPMFSEDIFEISTKQRFNAILSIPFAYDIIEQFLLRANKKLQYVEPEEVLEDIDIPGKHDENSENENKLAATSPAAPQRVVVAASASTKKMDNAEDGGLEGLSDKNEVVLASDFLLSDVQRGWKLLQLYKVFHTVELGAKLGLNKLNERYPESGAITPVDLSKSASSGGGQRQSMFSRMLSSKTPISSKNNSSKMKKTPNDSGCNDYSGEATPQLLSPNGGAVGAFSSNSNNGSRFSPQPRGVIRNLEDSSEDYSGRGMRTASGDASPSKSSKRVSFSEGDNSGPGLMVQRGATSGSGDSSMLDVGSSRKDSSGNVSGEHSKLKRSTSSKKLKSGASEFVPLDDLLPGAPATSWKNVCKYLKAESVSLLGGAKATVQYVKNMASAKGFNLLSRIAQMEVQGNVHDIHPEDQESANFAAAVGRITDELAVAIEKQLLIALRNYLPWIQFLENLRKERIRVEGSESSSNRLGDEVEIDPQGRARTIPGADYVIDTDVLHGSKQRISVGLCKAELLKKIELILERRLKKQGELACVIQYGFEIALPALQRAFKRFVGRLRRLKMITEVVWGSRHAAAVVIQSWARQVIQFRLFAEILRAAREKRNHACAVIIQSMFRCHRWSRRFKEHLHRKFLEKQYYAATHFQAMIRGFLSRGRLTKRLEEERQARNASEREWACIVIQKIGRGYLARHRTIRSMHIRKGLSAQALQMAERYLQTGDLWGFMKEISDEFSRLNNEIAETRHREDKWAYTFIQKVLAHRQGQFDMSWDQFSRAITAGPNGKPTISTAPNNDVLSGIGGDSRHVNRGVTGGTDTSLRVATAGFGPRSAMQSRSNTLLSADAKESGTAGSVRFAAGTRGGEEQDEFGRSGSFNVRSGKMSAKMGDGAACTTGNDVPGTLLRHAVTATVSKNLAHEVEKQLNSTSRSVSLLTDAREAYGDNGKTNYLKDANNTKAKSLKGKNKSKSQQSQSSGDLGSVGSRQRTATTATGSGKRKKKMSAKEAALLGIELKPLNTVSSASSDWLSAAIPKNKRDDLQSPGLSSPVGTGARHHKLPPMTGASGAPGTALPAISSPTPNNGLSNGKRAGVGDTLLVDVPLGINDSVENLLHAAALRCFVPDFFCGENHSSAYQVYLALPDKSLSKVRYESEAFKYSQSAINKLRIKGLLNIKDMLPTSKFIMFMREVSAPLTLTYAAIDVITALKSIGKDIPVGFTHKATQRRTEALLKGEGTVSEVLKASHIKEDPVGESFDEEVKEHFYNNNVQFVEENGEIRPQLPRSEIDIQMEEYHSKLLAMDKNAEDRAAAKKQAEAEAEYAARTVVANKTLEKLIEDGSWNSMNAPVDDIILHAAFLTCPFVPGENNEETTGIPVEAVEVVDTPAMGQAAFRAHNHYIQSLVYEKDVKEATKRRYRAALIMSTPFNLKLKANKVYVAKDFLKVNIEELGMPPALQGQVEALLSVIALTAAKAKPAFSYHNYEAKNEDVFTIPLLYDPRFQRGPLDPYGRPPRLGLLESKKEKPRSASATATMQGGEVEESTVLEGDGGALNLPGGIWDSGVIMESNIPDASTILDEEDEHYLDDVDNASDGEHHLDAKDKTLFSFHASDKAPHKKDKSSVPMASSSSDWEAYQKRLRVKPVPAYGDSVHHKSNSQGATSTTPHGDAKSKPVQTPGSTTATPGSVNKRKKKPSKPKNLFSTDFTAYVKNGFERPYVCSQCNQAFHRMYTLKIHERSHDAFGNYHKFKSEPQLFLDDDQHELVLANMRKYVSSISLPPLIQEQLDVLQTNE